MTSSFIYNRTNFKRNFRNIHAAIHPTFTIERKGGQIYLFRKKSSNDVSSLHRAGSSGFNLQNRLESRFSHRRDVRKINKIDSTEFDFCLK